jgi:hypothetical protein
LVANQGEGFFKNGIYAIKAENSNCKAGTFFTGRFFDAEFLVKEVADLFDEDS